MRNHLSVGLMRKILDFSLVLKRCNNFSAGLMRKISDFSLVLERCNNFSAGLMRKTRGFSLVLERCNKIRLRLMRKISDFSALWNILETKKESVHSRNSLGDHTLSFCINGETSVGILQQPHLLVFPGVRSQEQIQHLQIQPDQRIGQAIGGGPFILLG